MVSYFCSFLTQINNICLLIVQGEKGGSSPPWYISSSRAPISKGVVNNSIAPTPPQDAVNLQVLPNKSVRTVKPKADEPYSGVLIQSEHIRAERLAKSEYTNSVVDHELQEQQRPAVQIKEDVQSEELLADLEIRAGILQDESHQFSATSSKKAAVAPHFRVCLDRRRFRSTMRCDDSLDDGHMDFLLDTSAQTSGITCSNIISFDSI